MRLKNDIIIFSSIFVFLCVIVLNFLIFPDFDWLNYRFYNCWAFLTGRLSQDFIVSNFRTCINPLIDIPDYFLLFKLNNHPYFFIFISILDSTFFIFLVYKIAYEFLNNKFAVLFSVAYIAASPVMMLQMSFDQNDIKIAVLCLLAFYLILKNIFLNYSKKRNWMIALAGLIIGAALGFKLTAVVYAVSLSLIMLILYRKIDKPFKTLFYFLSGIVIAFLIIDGFWLYLCYKIYHNPFFPYFNDIFKSEYADSIKLLDKDYSHLQPRSLQEFIFYPFFKNFADRLFGTDNFSWDPRYAINFTAVLFIAVFCIQSFLSSKKIDIDFLKVNNFNFILLLVLFSIIPYYVNLVFFCTYRYIVANSAVYGIVLYITVCLICSKMVYKKYIITILSVIFLLYVYLTSNMGDLEYVKRYNKTKNLKYTNVLKYKDLHFEDESYVIILNTGVSVAAVGQNPNAYYIGFVFPRKILQKELDVIKNFDIWYNTKFMYSDYMEKKMEEILASDKKIYILYIESPEYRFGLDGLHLLDKEKKRRVENCDFIDMEIYNSTFWGVEIKKCEFNKHNI